MKLPFLSGSRKLPSALKPYRANLRCPFPRSDIHGKMCITGVQLSGINCGSRPEMRIAAKVFNRCRPQKMRENLFCFEHFNGVFHIFGLNKPQNTPFFPSKASVSRCFQLFGESNFRIDNTKMTGSGRTVIRKFRAALCVLTADSPRTGTEKNSPRRTAGRLIWQFTECGSRSVPARGDHSA